MANDKIVIKSGINGTVIIDLPNFNFHRELIGKDSRFTMSRDMLTEAMYDYGFQQMVETGTLFIEDMDFKKEVGLEPEDATEPVNHIELTDQYLKRLISLMPLAEFKEAIKKLSSTQKDELVRYAVVHNADFKFDRLEELNNACHVNFLKMVELHKQSEE